MDGSEVITRFAPSPTGKFHIGGARTALYAWLWARKNHGKFILRIEDTDKKREMPGGVENIQESLRWLGIDWDEGPILQSTRLPLYQKHAEELVEKGSAYYCDCSPERLQSIREEAMREKKILKYDGHCRGNLKKPEKKFVIRLDVSKSKEEKIKTEDIIRGKVVFDRDHIDDQVLLKSDGWPTYHLANVVDDHDMGITYVIRGEEWLSSLPKHILLYQAFGWTPPKFAHLSLFLSQGGGKMSKRHNDTSLLGFRDEGYLSEAVMNFIALLGWNPKTEQEIFSQKDLIQLFDLKNLHKANPIFDITKLDAVNALYIRKKENQELLQLCRFYEPQLNEAMIALEKDRIKTLKEIVEKTRYFFEEPIYETDLLSWKNQKPSSQTLQELYTFLASIEDFTAKNLETLILAWIQKQGLKNGEVLWPLRVALSGLKASPGPFDIAAILKKEKTLARLQSAINRL